MANRIFAWILEAGLRASLLVPVVLGAQWLRSLKKRKTFVGFSARPARCCLS
ncbi:MAG: hypothetical protein ACO3JG_13760 [Luteolibacter sp.]